MKNHVKILMLPSYFIPFIMLKEKCPYIAWFDHIHFLCFTTLLCSGHMTRCLVPNMKSLIIGTSLETIHHDAVGSMLVESRYSVYLCIESSTKLKGSIWAFCEA